MNPINNDLFHPNNHAKKGPRKSGSLSRSGFFKLSGSLAGAMLLPGFVPAKKQVSPTLTNQIISKPADYTLRISKELAELAPDRVISTTAYNGELSGRVIRLKEGKRITMEIHNDTDTPEQVHWHGQFVPDTIDGAAEEGTPYCSGTRATAYFVYSRSGRLAVCSYPRACGA